MNSSTIPPTLTGAILTEPFWLQAWVLLLVIAQLGAVLFVVGKENGNWIVRKECLAIIPGFIAAGIIMDWMYGQYGYVRLLGLAHLIAWTGPFIWVSLRCKFIDIKKVYGKYILFYLVISGTSLLIDALDVIRYMLGDGDLFMRWG